MVQLGGQLAKGPIGLDRFPHRLEPPQRTAALLVLTARLRAHKATSSSFLLFERTLCCQFDRSPILEILCPTRPLPGPLCAHTALYYPSQSIPLELLALWTTEYRLLGCLTSFRTRPCNSSPSLAGCWEEPHRLHRLGPASAPEIRTTWIPNRREWVTIAAGYWMQEFSVGTLPPDVRSGSF